MESYAIAFNQQKHRQAWNNQDSKISLIALEHIRRNRDSPEYTCPCVFFSFNFLTHFFSSPMVFYFLSTFSNINFRSQFGASAEPLRIKQLLRYWPFPMNPLSIIKRNNLICVLAYFQPARRLYISEPARICSSGS